MTEKNRYPHHSKNRNWRTKTILIRLDESLYRKVVEECNRRHYSYSLFFIELIEEHLKNTGR